MGTEPERTRPGHRPSHRRRRRVRLQRPVRYVPAQERADNKANIFDRYHSGSSYWNEELVVTYLCTRRRQDSLRSVRHLARSQPQYSHNLCREPGVWVERDYDGALERRRSYCRPYEFLQSMLVKHGRLLTAVERIRTSPDAKAPFQHASLKPFARIYFQV